MNADKRADMKREYEDFWNRNSGAVLKKIASEVRHIHASKCMLETADKWISEGEPNRVSMAEKKKKRETERIKDYIENIKRLAEYLETSPMDDIPSELHFDGFLDEWIVDPR